MEEVWKDIPGYEGLYQASNIGRIRGVDRYIGYKNGRKRLWKGQIKTQRLDYKGYLRVEICKDGTQKTEFVHQLVALAFIPNPDKKPYINHKDGNPQNNNTENLEWCTPRENTIHSINVLKNGIKTVNQYDLDGNFIASYPSLIEAERQTGVSRHGISNVAAGRRNKAGNFKWRLAENVA